MKKRKAKFKVSGRFDGKVMATVEIEYHGPDMAFFRVRPYHRREVFELSLADVARGVIYDVTKRDLAAAAPPKKYLARR